MKIHGMSLIRNEKENYLRDWISQMIFLCNGKITVMDDNSYDGTLELLQEYGFNLIRNKECLWEKNEVLARKTLWNKTIETCDHGDWIICLDADELFVKNHIQYVVYVIKYLSQYNIEQVDALGFKLFDMWNDTHYREDKWWTAHLRNWCMAVRYNKNKNYEWHEQNLHCGRFPKNAAMKMSPSLIPIKHMGWSKKELRQKKYERYSRIDNENEYGIIDQYKSILDENPNLIEFFI